MSELRGWSTEGARKETIEDETTFADPDVIAAIVKCKSVFDQLEPDELRKARTRSNPFETIRAAFFLNRRERIFFKYNLEASLF
jgi:cap1 methyltransferase